MPSKVLRFSNLFSGTRPNTVYAQFSDQKHRENIVEIYTHANHRSHAWVIFSVDVSPGEHEQRCLNGTEQKYYAYESNHEEIPFDITSHSSKINRYTTFVAEKKKEAKTSTLVITGLTSSNWSTHLDEILSFESAYRAKDTAGNITVQFRDMERAETMWESIKETGMHKIYHVTARFVHDVYSEEEVKQMYGDDSDEEVVI
ncbi:hypothetical protein C7974DRAFT_377277 [Boeremia exigua]|uniref:uncharacterized protein n=1 Tax=Boeremia exigua TaxID=749465 RepID=UPI001E8D2951|nr:uncharacterized protein C7974DRAFT_377277 [Boeremia exigua]KAH6625821.1 hypothetical protein C7974DRAFT_377277 [Boeremia exigua]